MIIKIYLIISILTLIMLILQSSSEINRVKNKYGDKLDEFEKKDIVGTILSWIKMMIISFIPIYHIFMIVGFVFFTSKITERTDEIVKTAMK